MGQGSSKGSFIETDPYHPHCYAVIYIVHDKEKHILLLHERKQKRLTLPELKTHQNDPIGALYDFLRSTEARKITGLLEPYQNVTTKHEVRLLENGDKCVSCVLSVDDDEMYGLNKLSEHKKKDIQLWHLSNVPLLEYWNSTHMLDQHFVKLFRRLADRTQ